MIFSLRLSQKEIAQHLGYKNANVITMFHQGRTKLPINKVGLMADALKTDKRFLLDLAMTEYMPDAWVAIKECLSEDLSVSATDLALVNAMKTHLAGHPVVGVRPSHLEVRWPDLDACVHDNDAWTHGYNRFERGRSDDTCGAQLAPALGRVQGTSHRAGAPARRLDGSGGLGQRPQRQHAAPLGSGG